MGRPPLFFFAMTGAQRLAASEMGSGYLFGSPEQFEHVLNALRHQRWDRVICRSLEMGGKERAQRLAASEVGSEPASSKAKSGALKLRAQRLAASEVGSVSFIPHNCPSTSMCSTPCGIRGGIGGSPFRESCNESHMCSTPCGIRGGIGTIFLASELILLLCSTPCGIRGGIG